jgi:hypothetical protein
MQSSVVALEDLIQILIGGTLEEPRRNIGRSPEEGRTVRLVSGRYNREHKGRHTYGTERVAVKINEKRLP